VAASGMFNLIITVIKVSNLCSVSYADIGLRTNVECHSKTSTYITDLNDPIIFC